MAIRTCAHISGVIGNTKHSICSVNVSFENNLKINFKTNQLHTKANKTNVKKTPLHFIDRVHNQPDSPAPNINLLLRYVIMQ